MTSHRSSVLVEFMLLLIFIGTIMPPCKAGDIELEMLLSLKASVRDPFQYLRNWNNVSSDVPLCKWKGVTCFDSSHVSKIELPGKNLSGKIPESIFRLRYIQTIDLSNNQFFGEIPRLNTSSSLRYLNLSNNNLTGSLPSGNYFPVLETLDLSNNMLSGEISPDIGLLSGLKVLDLGGNVLSGKIPTSVTNMTMLEVLTLASNQLTGVIPDELGFMKSLRWIYLGYNNFSGEIPRALGELTFLNHLDLVYNNLTGEIPSSLGNLTNLEYLFLYFNKLTGSIPSTMFNLRKLVSLDVSDNSLSGEISEEFSLLQNLEILHLFSNNFSGKIPNALSSLPHLQVLQLWSNRLTGEIPKDLGKYNNLTVLDLSTNNLTGKIPENICASGRLYKLILFSNSLEGEIPKNLSHCTSLQRVRIQKNRLSGQLRPEFTQLPLIYYLDASSNNFSGRIDDRTWNMPQLQMLNLADNKFSGQFPSSFGSDNLENLDLSGNKFSGNIPQSYGGFSQLMELKLNENDLISGPIPYQLSYCNKLVIIDLSHNHLTGEIPDGLAKMPVLGQLDLSYNDLTGKIPSDLGKVESLVQVNISHNHFHGSLPSTGAFLAINSSAVTGNNLCGGGETSGLPPCDNGSKRHAHLFVLTLVLSSFTTFLIIVLLAILIRRRRGIMEPKKIQSEDGTWELQFVNSWKSVITIKDILSSIREDNLFASGRLGLSYKGKSSSDNKLQFLATEIASVPSHCWINWSSYCKLHHPNIVKLLAMCRSEKAGILVYEYIEGNDLSRAIPLLSLERRLNVAVQIARALNYLHCYCSPAVVAGSITPRKIMIDGKNQAYLRLNLPGINDLISSGSKIFESSAYEAPEIENSKGFTEKSDIYGFGLLLIELLTGKSPEDTEHRSNIVEWATYCYSDCHIETWVDSNIMNTDIDTMNSHRKNQIVEAMNLSLQCTAREAQARPRANDVAKAMESIVKSSRSYVSCIRV